MPVPTTENLMHYRGDTFLAYVHLWEDAAETIPCDLSQAVVAAQLRLSATAVDVVTDFDVTVAGNTITLALTHDQAMLLPAKSVYDVQVDWLGDETNVQTVLRGTLSADADVTRAADEPANTKAGTRHGS